MQNPRDAPTVLMEDRLFSPQKGEDFLGFSAHGHLRWGFLGNQAEFLPWGYLPSGTFLLELGRAPSVIRPYFEEAKLAAMEVCKSSGEPPWLCMSGGVDSECMALAFLAARQSFRVAILRMSGDLNLFDIGHAVEFCETHGIAYEYFDLDVPEFYLGGEHFTIARNFRCISPQLTAHLSLLSRLPGFPVLAWNVPHPYVTTEGLIKIGMPSDLYFSYCRFLAAGGRSGSPFFFLHTPGLFYAAFSLLTIRNSVRSPEKALTYALKCDAYREAGFPVKNRINKFTGFEKVKGWAASHFGEDFGAFDRHFRRPLIEEMPPESRSYFRFDALAMESLGAGLNRDFHSELPTGCEKKHEKTAARFSGA
jgi:hypothetical protein